MPDESTDKSTQEKIYKDQLQALAEQQKKQNDVAAMQHSMVGKPLKKETQLRPIPQANKNWSAVLAAYKKDYSKQNNMGVDKMTGALVFASHEDAVAFFEQQAKLGQEFLAQKYPDTAGDRFYVFSCGNKKLYQGTSLAEIKNQLDVDSKSNPGDLKIKAGLETLISILQSEEKPCHTNRMRTHLQDHRESTAEPETLGLSR